MPALSFQKQFGPAILAGSKPFTLRELRKDGLDPKAGQTLYLYTGQRSKQCKKIGEKPCRFAVTINLSWRLVLIPTIGAAQATNTLELFATLDGFNNYDEFCQFHKITAGMTTKKMRLIAWVTREELKELMGL